MALEFNTQLNSILKKTGEAIGSLWSAVDDLMNRQADYVTSHEDELFATTGSGYTGTANWFGYREWKSGHVEFWGRLFFQPSSSSEHDFTLSIPFPDGVTIPASYQVVLTPRCLSGNTLTKLHNWATSGGASGSSIAIVVNMDYGAPTTYDFYIHGYAQTGQK